MCASYIPCASRGLRRRVATPIPRRPVLISLISLQKSAKFFPCHTSKISPVTPVFATDPKTLSRNSFACHTCETPRGSRPWDSDSTEATLGVFAPAQPRGLLDEYQAGAKETKRAGEKPASLAKARPSLSAEHNRAATVSTLVSARIRGFGNDAKLRALRRRNRDDR
jgi:hypothetical protein